MVFKRYADDYENEIVVDDKGRETKAPVYRGKLFEINLDQENLSRFKRSSLTILAVTTVVHVAAGFVDNTGMNQFYVALPYVTAFFPLLYAATGAFRLPVEKRQYRRDEIGLSFERFKSSSMLLTIILGAGGLGELFYLLTGLLNRDIVRELLFFVPELLALAGGYLLIRLSGRVQTKVIQTKPQKPGN
jgi:hypothetical protein